jgi:hypothetical protein
MENAWGKRKRSLSIIVRKREMALPATVVARGSVEQVTPHRS